MRHEPDGQLEEREGVAVTQAWLQLPSSFGLLSLPSPQLFTFGQFPFWFTGGLTLIRLVTPVDTRELE